MNKTEKLLKICADTMQMSGWHDALSIMTEKYSLNELSDDLLDNVAGGVTKNGGADTKGRIKITSEQQEK